MWALIAATLTAATLPSAADEADLVARYAFDEGQGEVVRDVSGHGADGTVHGARFLRTRTGHCVEFDGVASYIDCGAPEALDLREQVTVEAWVMPSGVPGREPGIAGKQFSSYLLTYYTDGNCWWYINEGGNNVHAPVMPGRWQHVAGTFDGETLRLYVNGRLAAGKPSKHKTISPGGNFTIGAVMGALSADDPNYRNSSTFPGLIDDVRVYSRALGPGEIASHAAADVGALEVFEPFPAIEAMAQIGGDGLTVTAGRGGELQVDCGGTSYLVESVYSFPGEAVGWNRLSGTRGNPEAAWEPRASTEDGMLCIRARASGYDLLRSVRVVDGELAIEDTLTPTGIETVGVITQTSVTSTERFTQACAAGGAEAPIIFTAGEEGGLGIVLEDSLSRRRFDPSTGLRANQVSFRLHDIALAPGTPVTLRWRLLPLPKATEYFDFINALRRRWGSNFTVQGPFDWISMTSPLLDRPEELKAYLQRKRVKLMAIVPWLDYDAQSEDHVWPRDEFKARALKAIAALKAADPDILCVGCIETDWVTIYPERLAGGERLPVAGTGAGGHLGPELAKVIDDADLPWKDSVKRGADGGLELELYMRGGKPQTALSVYPAVGNYQFQFLMDQARFLFDECGADGFYIDEFSQSWRESIRSYDGWDGRSIEVDPRTGKAGRRYVDCGLAGIEARVKLCRYALERGKVVIANTYATTGEEQSLPINRFSETQGAFDPMAFQDGVEPPGIPALFRSNLASPIGLGIIGHPEKHDTARRIMKALVTYLRHGMVYYHYAIEDIPQDGEGSGEYGPINHMFPLTPVELNEGWIVGKERTIICVSGRYDWAGEQEPIVRVFDLDGRPDSAVVEPAKAQDGWTVDVKLKDWAQIAVIAGE